MQSGGSDSPGGRRRPLASGLLLVAAVGAVVVYAAARDDDGGTAGGRVETAPTDTGATIATPALAPTSSSAPESGEAPIPSTTVEEVSVAAEITRPVVESPTCEPVSAREIFTEGITLFARPSANPIPIQIVADPVGGLVGRFAVVQRFFGDGRTPNGQETVDIDGTTFWIRLVDNGNGVAEWDVGDGSLGSVRSRGLDRAALVELLGALEPRGASEPIPGFEHARDTGGLELLHEQMNTDVAGEVASSECVVAATGYRYRISAINGDPVFQYGGVIDRPVPLEVGTSGPTLIVIDGVSDPSGPMVRDVVQADPDTWIALRSRPLWEEASEPRAENIREGSDVVVALQSVDGSMPQSFLTLRLRTQEGVAFLEVDTGNAVLAPDAALWRTTLDPGNDGLNTASVGPVMGFRVGDLPRGESIDVTVSVIDGGEFVLQSTGTIRLFPS